LKIALLLTAGVSVHLSLSPPNPPAPPKHCIPQRSFFERCMMVWLETVLDALATSSVAFPSLPHAPLSSHLTCPSSSAAQTLIAPSLLLVVGMLFTLFGAILRLICYKTLGPMFTFELAITPMHALVTHGPYAYVRHPSYTGVYMTLLGATAVALAPGTWLRECWLQIGYGCCNAPFSETNTHRWTFGAGIFFAWFALAFWILKVVYALRSTNRRLVTEDTELRHTFGLAWESYADRVRWRLLPGVY
ncbi:ICMT-domain-containing protein, partial [Laetiporus sulphureus 93-53]